MDASNLWSSTTSADAPGFTRHPRGTFQGTVTGIEERDWNGKVIYDVLVETDVGNAKMGVWEVTDADVAEVGVEKAKASIARNKRLVVDLGQPEPATHEDWLVALGQCVGAACQLVVKANTKTGGEDLVYINAPDASTQQAGAKPGITKPGAPRAGGAPTAAAGARAPTGRQGPPAGHPANVRY